jgi:hypothetical protein
MKQFLFFATRVDLLNVLPLVERDGAVKYVRMGIWPAADVASAMKEFASGIAIPTLGMATADSSNACDAFLVTDVTTSIIPRVLPGGRVCIDQLANPDSIEFKPGGVWNDGVLLNGRVATASETPASQALMRRFHRVIKSAFSRIKAFYVGPNACAFLESGNRLSISVHSPSNLDVTAVDGE